MIPDRIELEIPEWIRDLLEDTGPLPQLEDRVRLACAIAMQNVERRLGGPFGAVVFSRKDWQPVSAGVNLVRPTGFSVAHAEIVAISTAQAVLNTHDLHEYDLELVSSCEPCAMCMGAVPWSGISSLVYSATDEDATAVGFDEGDKPDDWRDGYRRRGIDVTGPVLREEGRKALQLYAVKGGEIYNSIGRYKSNRQ